MFKMAFISFAILMTSNAFALEGYSYVDSQCSYFKPTICIGSTAYICSERAGKCVARKIARIQTQYHYFSPERQFLRTTTDIMGVSNFMGNAVDATAQACATRCQLN
jgi:hypothetical protein